MASAPAGTPVPPSRRWPRLAVGLLLALGATVAWVALHLTGSDALPALGTARTTPTASPPGMPPVRYYLQVPPGAGPSTPTVALVASLGRPVSDFNTLTTRLVQAGYRTVCVESRGVGDWAGGGLAAYSLADLAGDVHRALADAGVASGARVHVLGHAFGNRVARSFAARYPAQTTSVLLVAAGDKADLPPGLKRSLTLSTLGFVPWAWREGAVSQAFFAPGNPVPEAWQRGWSVWGAMAQARAAQAANRSAFHDAGRAPMLVLQADQDLIAPPREAGELLKAQYGERVSLVPIARAGHALLPEQPDAIAEAVLRFLRAQPP